MIQEISQQADLDRLRARGEGYIYNDFAGRGSGGSEYNVLHWAGCRTLEQANLTNPKIFFEELSEATAWLVQNRGAEGKGWKRCGTCAAAPD